MPGLVAHYGVLIVALIIFAGENGLPTLVPGEIAILIAGSEAVHSMAQLIGVLLLFGVVDVLACSTIHLASRTGGNRLLVKLLRRLQPNAQQHEEIVDGWRRRLGGHDTLVVFVTRLIPMFRLYASITTGLIRIRFRDFIAGAVPAAFLWAATPLTLGYLMRSKIGSLEHQYPRMTELVVIASVSIVVLLALTCWVRGAGSRPGILRRLRLVLGLGAVGGALTRLILVVLHGDRALQYRHLLPSLSALSLWVASLSLVALGLLWVAAHDLRIIRRYSAKGRSMGALSAVGWVGLMGLFCLLNTLANVQHPAILG